MADKYNEEILKSSKKGTDKNDEVRHTKNIMLTIAETEKYLRISHSTLYGLINQNQIKTVHIGKRRFITFDAIDEFLKKMEGYLYEL